MLSDSPSWVLRAGDREVLDRLSGHAQGQGGPGEREVRLGAQRLLARRHVGAGHGDDQAEGAGGQLVGAPEVAAHEVGGPQPHEAVHEHGPLGEALGQRDGALEGDRELGVGVAAVRVEGRGHRGERPDLAEVPLGAGRQVCDERQRGVVETDGLGVGEHAGGHLGGPVVVLERPDRVAGTGVLVGQLGGHLVGAPGVQDLERLGQPAVQQPPGRRADQVVRRGRAAGRGRSRSRPGAR